MENTAQDILATGMAAARSLFPGNDDEIKAAFHRLVKVWHPDRNADPRATQVLAHLNLLRDAAVRAATPAPGKSREFAAGGTRWRLKFLRERAFDGGTVYVGRRTVAYHVEGDGKVPPLQAMRFHDDRMKGEMERFLPALEKTVATDDGAVHVFKRTPDQVLMADLMAWNPGPIDPAHVAWMVSGMANICCYLGWAGIAHAGIAPETLLVSPKYHSVALTGPLLHATAFGERPKSLPERTLDAVPRLAVAGETTDARVDLALVRQTARELLGDPGGTRLLRDASVPRPMAMWLVTPPEATAKADYAGWERARDAGFGKRRFVEMKVSADAVYAA